MSACAQPVSWLLLERYQLGEVTASERARVETHLEACTRCRADLDRLAADARPLPPLPEPAPAGAHRFFALAAASAAAAALVLVFSLWAPWRPAARAEWPPQRIQVKGGELAMTLIRERSGAVIENPASYEDGDRFRIELTCPPGELSWDVVVFQSGRAFFPYEPAGSIACGNRVGLPGAFRLSGSAPAVVCALAAAAPPDRAAVAGAAPDDLPVPAACLGLAAER